MAPKRQDGQDGHSMGGSRFKSNNGLATFLALPTDRARNSQSAPTAANLNFTLCRRQSRVRVLVLVLMLVLAAMLTAHIDHDGNVAQKI